jgi:ABC-type phosphate transport system substrate-binding protein
MFRNIMMSLSLLLASAGVCWAEVAVIVNASVDTTASMKEIKKVYLGKSKSLSGGYKVKPIALAEGSETRDAFNQAVLKKSDSQLKSYWAKLIFTGKGHPPKEMENDQEVIRAISDNPKLIGYVEASSVTPEVKVIASF